MKNPHKKIIQRVLGFSKVKDFWDGLTKIIYMKRIKLEFFGLVAEEWVKIY